MRSLRRTRLADSFSGFGIFELTSSVSFITYTQLWIASDVQVYPNDALSVGKIALRPINTEARGSIKFKVQGLRFKVRRDLSADKLYRFRLSIKILHPYLVNFQ